MDKEWNKAQKLGVAAEKEMQKEGRRVRGGKKTTPRGMRTEKEMKERAEFALVLKENMFTLSDTECENKVQKEITTRTKV